MGIRVQDRWWHPWERFSSCPTCRQDYPGVRGQNEAWYETDLGDGWLAAFRLAAKNGHPIIAELRIFPNHPGKRDPGTWCVEQEGIANAVKFVPSGGITPKKVRGVTVEREMKTAIVALRDFYEFIRESAVDRDQLESDDEMPLVIAGMSAAIKAEPRRRKPGGALDVQLAEIARRYEQIYDNPDTRRTVTKSLAEEIGKSGGQTSRLIHQARERGLLSGGDQRGRSGGRATPRAHEILRNSRQENSESPKM